MTEDLLLKLCMMIAWACNTIIYYKRYNLNRKMMEWEELAEKGLTVKELYELLEPIIDEYGDLEVRVSYDSSLVSTDIKHKEPKIVLKPMRDYSYVIFEGY